MLHRILQILVARAGVLIGDLQNALGIRKDVILRKRAVALRLLQRYLQRL